MTPEELSDRLAGRPFVSITPATWAALEASLRLVEHHPTAVAGQLTVVELPSGLAVVEQPNATQYLIRRFPSREEAAAFVQQRLEQYERMWDGCGCKIDYFS